MAVVAVTYAAAVIGQTAQPADAVGAVVPAVGDSLVLIYDLTDTVEAVIAVLGTLAAGIGTGLDVAGFVIGKTGNAGIGAGLA